jgi:SPP1 family predicted phage head-tail adaptor
MARVSTGDLDRRITLQRFTEARDEFNQPIEDWLDLKEVWARRRDVSDQERYDSGKVNATNISRFVVRSNSITKTLTAVDRISYEGAFWNISGIKETQDGRDRFLEITAVRASD